MQASWHFCLTFSLLRWAASQVILSRIPTVIIIVIVGQELCVNMFLTKYFLKEIDKAEQVTLHTEISLGMKREKSRTKVHLLLN